MNYLTTEKLIYNYKAWLKITHPNALYSNFNSFLQEAGYEVINFVEHHFQPQGYTCLWLLAESHLAIHTFPEKGLTYIELSGCNPEKNNAFVALVEQLQTESSEKEGRKG